MRAKTALLIAFLLAGANAVTAQPLPCASVAPEVRERVREVGACRDATSDDAASKEAAPASPATTTMKLSDGTVVRVPREIRSNVSVSSNINGGRKRAPVSKTAAPKGASRAGESTQSEPSASGAAASAVQKLQVPEVIGRSYADVGSMLTEFKVDRIEAAGAAPAGQVLAQEPAPATLALPGSTVSLQVSDGSLAAVADATPVAAPVGVAPPSMPAPAADSAPATATTPPPAPQPIVTTALRTRFPIAFSADAALILGAGVLVGLLLGALLMRQWLLRRKQVADENTALPPARYERPIETRAGAFAAEAVPEIRFAARLDPGEITIAFAPLLDSEEEVAIEQPSDQHA